MIRAQKPRVGRGLATAAAIALGWRGAALAQCAMCNTAAGASRVGWSLSVSVLFMLASLSVVVLWLVVVIARGSRRTGS